MMGQHARHMRSMPLICLDIKLRTHLRAAAEAWLLKK